MLHAGRDLAPSEFRERNEETCTERFRCDAPR